MIRSTLLARGCVAALAFAALPTVAGDESVVPPTKHQEEVLRGAQQTDTPSGAIGDVDCGMPASPHQQQVLNQGQPQSGQALQPKADMPATEHQQQVLKGDESGAQDSTAIPTEEDMPASPHQQQALEEGEPC
jgi:hypothetical protein